jgi:hypothetical protein
VVVFTSVGAEVEVETGAKVEEFDLGICEPWTGVTEGDLTSKGIRGIMMGTKGVLG